MNQPRSKSSRCRLLSRLAAPATAAAVLVPAVALAGAAPVSEPAALAAEDLGTLDSYHRSLAAVERSVRALGGPEGVAALDSVSFTVELVVKAVYQSPRPEPPYLEVPVILEVESAAGRRWARVATETAFPDASFRTIRVLGPTGGAQIDPETGGSTAAPIAWEDFARDFRRSPHLVIRDAWQRRAHLRWSGTAEVEGTVCDVVTFPYFGRQELAVAIDPQGRVLRLEILVDDLLTGDATVTTSFSDYRRDGDAWLPGRLRQVEAGVVAVEGRYRRYAVGGEVRSAAFTPSVPEGEGDRGRAEVATTGQGQPDPGPPVVAAEAAGGTVELAPGVHLLRRLDGQDYNSLLVDLGESFLVVEAPLGAGAAAEIAAAAAALDPDKPIRHLVPTHHHDDHAGGVPHLAAATAAAVVTTPGNESFFRVATAARRTLADAAVSPVGPARVILVRDGEWQPPGARVVQLLDVGPNGHSDEMLVAWLPEVRILFQGDLIRFPETGPLEPARPQGRRLLAFLDARGIEPARIVGVHGRPGTLEELRAAVAARQE